MNTKPITAISSYPDVDDRLGELRVLTGRVEQLRARAERRIQKIEAELAAATKPFQARAAVLDSEVLAFIETRAADFEQKRSLKLVHGTVGMRLGSPKVVCLDEAATIADLQKRRLKACVMVHYSLDRAAVRKLTPKVQAAVGVFVEQLDNAFYKLTEGPLAEAPALLVAGDVAGPARSAA